MTFVGIGHPDAQDQASFTSGRLLPQLDVVGLAAGAELFQLIGPEALTNLTFLLINAEGPAQVLVQPLTPTGLNELGTARQTFTFTEPGAATICLPTFGGGIELFFRNCGSSPVNFQVVQNTLFKSNVDSTYATYFDDVLHGTAVAQNDTVETFAANIWGQFDQVAAIVTSDSDVRIDVGWDLAYNAGGWTIERAIENIGSLSGAGTFPFSVPVRADSGRIIVTNTNATDPATVTISLHLSRFS